MTRQETYARARLLAQRHGPTAPVWRKRAAIFTGAVALGLVALLFAKAADWASGVFLSLVHLAWWAPLALTPAGFALLVWFTRRVAPAARGSGIPQIMAARLDPDGAMTALASWKTALVKFVSTILALLVGASVGREGPTVQISASIMAYAHRLFRVPIRASVMIAGGAAGVAAAFNTPLAGVTFAIEELAAAYEQKMTLLVMTAVLISGMVSLGIAGDYVYFGAMTTTLSLRQALLVVPVAGVIGGLAGGLFSKAMLAFSLSDWHPLGWLRRHPVLTAAVMGAIVAIVGCATGMTWGTSYEPARLMILGGGHAAMVRPRQVRRDAGDGGVGAAGRHLRTLAGDRRRARRSVARAVSGVGGGAGRAAGHDRLFHRRGARAADRGRHHLGGDRQPRSAASACWRPR